MTERETIKFPTLPKVSLTEAVACVRGGGWRAVP